MNPAPRTDCHQHLWTEPLLSALAGRSERPRVRRRDSGWVLELPGEPDYPIDGEAQDVAARAALVERDGVDLAIVAPSSPVGLEGLPPADAERLLDAYASGARELPDRFAAWGSAGTVEPDPGVVDAQLDAGLVGIALPASALGSRRGLEHCAPLLARLEQRGAPLFVHPGPAAGDAEAPPWWGALTDYVSQMHAAWHAFVAFGHELFPKLRVLFALLAGLAPLHVERLRARGGPSERTIDRNFFYDTSSYGVRALDALVRCVGVDQLVYGSDRPLAEPRACPLGEAARHATLVTNPARLLQPRSAA